MGWIRTNRRGGGALALLALAVQLVLGLGHLHVQTGAPHVVASVATLADAVADGGQPQGNADAACDICAVVHMASSGHVAEPPVLIFPARFSATRFAAVTAVAVIHARKTLPPSRAPPVV